MENKTILVNKLNCCETTYPRDSIFQELVASQTFRKMSVKGGEKRDLWHSTKSFDKKLTKSGVACNPYNSHKGHASQFGFCAFHEIFSC